MENKKVDDPGALRRLVRSPTGGRLGPRLSSTFASSSSTRSSSSSASSVTSAVDAEMPASCVDECALHRFIVWAAVKRNACQKMTPEERRECPLLRCRKRFPNHELMLQHLYSCDHLAGGEYWCYDCERPEQLSDVKCRRCLGHPSKRRKIITMAKSFFSSLGHKPRSHGLAVSMGMSLGMDSLGDCGIGQGSSSSGNNSGNNTNSTNNVGGGMDEPPSYDSVLFTPSPLPQAELFSTEIHEIGSSEVLLPTIPECETETEPLQAPSVPAPRMVPCLPPSTFPISPPGSHPGAVPLPSTMEAGFINWRPSPPSPPTVAPQSLMKPAAARLVDRPTLQLNTHLDHYRGQARRRSKALAPSSSVRSTSSTDSTDSTDSTASYNISPMSGWSGGWTGTSGFESALTSPDDLISPQSLLPTGPFVSGGCHTTTNTADASSSMRPVPFSDSEFENIVANSCPSELPADIPMFDDLPTTMNPQKTQVPMGLDHSAFSFDNDLQFQLPLEHQLPPTHTVDDLSLHVSPPPLAPSSRLRPPPPPQQSTNDAESSMMQHVGSSSLTTTTQALARSAQDALQMHIAESRSKIDDINENRLMVQLCQMPLPSVATAGLETMVDILEGRQASSPLNLLCFVHVVFSLSLVVHEQEASKHVDALFKQALLYSDWFSYDDKMLYIEVVYTLWKPTAVRDKDIVELLGMSKGKQPERSLPELRSDPLMLIAAYFLDELEYMAHSDSNHRGDVQHKRDNVGASHGSPFAIAARFMIENIFTHQYSHFPGFELGVEKIIGLVNSGAVGTVRRLELELMQIGKTYLPSDTFFDDYVEVVRRHTDSLYTQGPEASSRSAYHRCSIQLLLNEFSRSLVAAEAAVEASGAPGVVHGIVGVVPSGFDSFFDDMVNLNPGPGLDVDNMAGAPPLDAAEWTGEEPGFTSSAAAGSATIATPVPQMDDEALRSPVTATPSKAEPPAATSSTKVESDNCCKICGYRPKGDPRWFAGSMAKHMRTIHSENPQIFRCPYPGCTSQYSKRADNLRQHQIEKGHFVDDEGKQGRRPRKRKRASEGGGES
ncbi:hypothetical protein HDV57DRAFT_516674 [Trichoderma longibrachiatum]